jgi:hypothetical protein
VIIGKPRVLISASRTVILSAALRDLPQWLQANFSFHILRNTDIATLPVDATVGTVSLNKLLEGITVAQLVTKQPPFNDPTNSPDGRIVESGLSAVCAHSTGSQSHGVETLSQL